MANDSCRNENFVTAEVPGEIDMLQTLMFTARDAKTRFGEVLDEALGHPVGITRHDRLTAYVVSKRDFDAMTSRIQDLEDQLWLLKADAARRGGFASQSDVDALLASDRNTDDAVAVHKSGAKSRKKA
jgi:prevent-host-death family protein